MHVMFGLFVGWYVYPNICPSFRLLKQLLNFSIFLEGVGSDRKKSLDSENDMDFVLLIINTPNLLYKHAVELTTMSNPTTTKCVLHRTDTMGNAIQNNN